MIRLIPSDGTIIINKNDHNIKKLLQKGYWSKLITVDSKKSSGDFNLINHSLRKNKDNAVSNMVAAGYSKERIMKEINKCIVLCANCHRKVHHPKK